MGCLGGAGLKFRNPLLIPLESKLKEDEKKAKEMEDEIEKLKQEKGTIVDAYKSKLDSLDENNKNRDNPDLKAIEDEYDSKKQNISQLGQTYIGLKTEIAVTKTFIQQVDEGKISLTGIKNPEEIKNKMNSFKEGFMKNEGETLKKELAKKLEEIPEKTIDDFWV